MTCTNVDPLYTCDCNTGFVIDGSGLTCEGKDEVAAKTLNCTGAYSVLQCITRGVAIISICVVPLVIMCDQPALDGTPSQHPSC